MNIEDKAYFAVSPAETEKKIRDLTAAWRKLMNVADNLHGMANPSPEIMKRQDQVDADMERIGNQIAELKKSIGVQENVSVRLARPVEDKAYFDKRIEVETWKSPRGTTYIAGLHQLSGGSFQPFVTATYADGEQQLMTRNPPKFKTEDGARKWLSAEITRRKTPNARQGLKAKFDKEWESSGYTATDFFIMLERAMKSYEGQHDYEYRNKIIGHAKTLMQHPDFKVNGQSTHALAKKAFTLVKFKYARQGSKAKFAATRIWPNDYSEILNANAKYARLIFDRQKIIRANAGKRIKGEQPLEVPALPTAPEFPFAFADGDYVGLVLGGQTNVPKGATVKWAHNANSIKMSRTGTKAKFTQMPLLGTILPTADSIAADNSYAKQVEQMKLQVANKELKGLDKRVVGNETRYYKTLNNYAIVSQSGKILWFVVKSDGDYRQKLSRTGTKAKFASDTDYAHKNTIKIKGKSDKIYALIYAEEGYGDNLTGFWNGHVQNNSNPKVNDVVTIGQFKSKEAAKAAAIKALKQEEQGTNFSKSKFANRGAFAEASSSPVLGSLLEKKVMPEGGWRAVETDGGALVIAFEDNDIAGNFARRAAENGYSATAPMAMAGRFWNVKVQNENKN